MCLIVLAHRFSDRFPLILAANRDEDYERPTAAADFWNDEPAVLGGRDQVHGGTWLAITTRGRFGAVTNLRGAARSSQNRSRGELVREFVVGAQPAREYANEVERRLSDYAGFHLLAGEVGREVALLSAVTQMLSPGIHGLSNAPNGERWEKVDTAVAALHAVARVADDQRLADEILRIIGPPMKHGDPTRDLFIAGDRYGTRSSTAIVAQGDQFLFVEQTYGRGGLKIGERKTFRVRRPSER